MLDALRTTFAHPASIVGDDGWLSLIALAVAAMLLTLLFMAVGGRRVMRRSAVLAVSTGTLCVPMLIIVAALVIESRGRTGVDGGGMLIFAAVVLAICAVPVTLLTSLAYVLVRRKRAS